VKKKLSVLILAIFIATLLAACGSSTTPTSGQTPATAATTAPAQATATRAAPTTAPAPTLAATQPSASNVSGIPKVPPLPTLPAEAKKGGTLTVANAGPLPTNLPANPNTTETVGAWFNIRGLIWGPGLMSFNFTSLEWQLEYAEDLKVDESGKILTFKLRPDLKWSDGSPMTVDDFQYTFDNLSKPNKENPALNYARLADTARVASYKSDPATSTIVVTLAQAYARDLALYYSIYPPVPKKVWEGKPYLDGSNNPEIKKPTVVSGPYKIDNYDSGTQGTFVANPYYYRGKANFDTIVVKSFAPNLVYEAIKTGQADISFDVLPPSRYNEVKADTSVKTYEWTPANPNWRYIAYNTTAAPFNDKALRQAITHALDRDTLIRLAETGRAIPMYTFLTDNSPYYNPEVPKFAFSLDKAKKTLEESGYKLQGTSLLGKDGQPLKATLIHETTDAPGKLMATYLQAQLKQLGIEVQVEAREPQSYLSALVTKKYDFATSTTGLVFPDPDTPKYFFVSDGVYNVAGLKNARVDELFKIGSSELDTAKRKQIYKEIQSILAEEQAISIIYGRVPYIAASAKIGGIVPSKGRIDENYAIATWYFNQ
jgi:peptide/nickel transport system substrate-binding protein